MTQRRVAQIINNANLCEINNLLTQGHDMEYITSKEDFLLQSLSFLNFFYSDHHMDDLKNKVYFHIS